MNLEFAKFDCKDKGLPANVPWMSAPNGLLRMLSDEEYGKLLLVNTMYLERVSRAQREAQRDWDNLQETHTNRYIKSIAPKLKSLYYT